MTAGSQIKIDGVWYAEGAKVVYAGKTWTVALIGFNRSSLERQFLDVPKPYTGLAWLTRRRWWGSIEKYVVAGEVQEGGRE